MNLPVNADGKPYNWYVVDTVGDDTPVGCHFEETAFALKARMNQFITGRYVVRSVLELDSASQTC